MKKAQKRFLGTALTLSTVASIVAPVAVSAATVTLADAQKAVEAAKATPVFSLFNKAYEAVISLENKDEQAALLNELAPLWDKVNTPYVSGILAEMDSLAKDKNLKTYNGLLAKIEAETSSEESLNKAYLLGELTAWGQSGSLYTTEEKAAIDAIVKAWTDKTPASLAAAKDAAAKVTNAGSLEWLNEQITEVTATLSTTITSVKATGEKTIVVTFNKAIADTAKMSISLKKNSSTTSIAETKWNDDKTVATLTLGAKISDANYQVFAKYDAEEEVSSEVLALKTSTATNIEILSNNLVIASSTTGDDEDAATFRIRITNQYGEDITEDINVGDLKVKASDGDWDEKIGKNGLIRLEGKADGKEEFDVYGQVSVTVSHKPSATITTKTLTVVDAAKVVSITMGDLTPFDKDNKDRITTKTDFAQDYYLPLSVKNEEGIELTYKELLDALDDASSSNDDVFDVEEDAVDFLDELNNKPIVRLKNAESPESGKTVVSIASQNGVLGTKTIEVENAVMVDKLTVKAPDFTVKRGEEFVLNLTAYDQHGNQLVDEADYPEYRVNGNTVQFKDDEGDWGTEIEVDGASVATQIDYANNNALQLVFTPSSLEKDEEVEISWDTVTRNRSELTLKIEDAAYAETMGSISSSFINVMQGVSDVKESELKFDHLGLKDQYGDSIKLKGYTQGTAKFYDVDGNVIADPVADVAKIKTTKVEYTKPGMALADAKDNGDIITHKLVFEIKDANVFQFKKISSDKVSVVPVVAGKSTDITVKIVQEQYNKNEATKKRDVELDSAKTTLKSVELKDITGFTIDNFAKVYVGPEVSEYTAAAFEAKFGINFDAYNNNKELFGLIDGKKVKVSQALVSSAVSSVKGITATTEGGVKLVVDAPGALDNDDDTDKTGTVIATVEGYQGKTYTITKEFTYSDKNPETTTFEVRDIDDKKLVGSSYRFDVSELNGKYITTKNSTSASKAGIRFFTKDQYGEEYNGVDLTISNYYDKNGSADGVFSKPTIDANGVLTLVNANSGDTFTITAVTSKSEVRSITITIK